VQRDVTAWSDEDGVKLPSQWVETRPDARATYKIESASNAPIDDLHFAPPADTAARH
jgi:hypothetical protein